jgi:hypothetical protein
VMPHLSPKRPREMSAAGVASMASAAPSRHPRTLSYASCFLSSGRFTPIRPEGRAQSWQGQEQGSVAQERPLKEPLGHVCVRVTPEATGHANEHLSSAEAGPPSFDALKHVNLHCMLLRLK